MTTTAGHSFYIGPIGSFYNQVNACQVWFNWFSSFRGKDLNVIFYQNMPNVHNRYKSAERKISQKSPEYIYIKLFIAM
jgi:hypothetical protein